MLEWQDGFILENGQLNDAAFLKREQLDSSTVGRVIERIFLSPNESFIFKQFANVDQGEKEIWVQEHILGSFPDIYPKIMAKSVSEISGTSWIALTDLGRIKHAFSYEILHEVTKQMAWWHSLPVSRWRKTPSNGIKPKIEEVQSELLRSRTKITQTLMKLNIPNRKVIRIFSLLENAAFSKNLVLTHGDLHMGNYGISKNKLVILDWEYAHINTRFWDLYHMLDLTHPLYPKTVTNELRNKILNEYYDNKHTSGIECGIKNFKTEYYLFASAFSIWLIMLIKKDLEQIDKRWPEAALKCQLMETIENFKQCSDALSSYT